MEPRPPSAVHWKLTLSYDGTLFHGWQVQPRCVTVQGALASAIGHVTGESVLPQGSGRTDAGVHALGQVASFALTAPIPPSNLLRALNRTLPASIRVLQAEVAPADFHARHSAIAKTYEYRIFQGGSVGKICPPFLAPYVYAVQWPLNVDALHESSSLVCGVHDFTSFAATDPDLGQRLSAEPPSNVRTVYESFWTEDGESLTYRVRGSGFLHHMVRNLVGTFLEAGRERIVPAQMTEILDARSRSAAGPTAPARGLFLVSVDY